MRTLPQPSRRDLLAAALALGLPPVWATAETAPASEPPPLATQRLATAWREASPAARSGESPQGDRVGVVEIHWQAGHLRLASAVPVASRGHGLLALDDGGFVAVATRPGRWLLRCDAAGEVLARHAIEHDSIGGQQERSFDGHVEASADGQWLFTVETDPATGQGWISVRDLRSLARVAQFPTGGIDPHQMLWAADGRLLVVNGGIPRDAAGRKLRLAEMAPSLVRLDPASGRIDGRWALPDARLSLRHMAWSAGPAPLLGIALQAEHDEPAQRAEAPTLAVWDGRALMLPCRDPAAGGYAGDIAAGPGGGFVISAQKQRQALWWQPGRPDSYTPVAELTEPCALVAAPDAAGVTLHAARGAALWHTRQAPRMLAWPVALMPDNHAVALRPA